MCAEEAIQELDSRVPNTDRSKGFRTQNFRTGVEDFRVKFKLGHNHYSCHYSFVLKHSEDPESSATGAN